MFNLVYKEFVQIRQYLLQIVGFLALAIVIFGRSSPSFAMTYIYVMPVVFAMNLPQIVFGQEERGNTFVFLRALPIRPAGIVAAKYLVSVLLTVAFLAVIGLAAVAGLVPTEMALVAVSAVGLISFALSGVSFFLHFWLGQKSARVALILVTFALAAPVMLVAGKMSSLGATFTDGFARLTALASTPAGVCLATAVGLALLGASYAASAWIFTRRDLSRMP